jgi:hypothetical protein
MLHSAFKAKVFLFSFTFNMRSSVRVSKWRGSQAKRRDGDKYKDGSQGYRRVGAPCRARNCGGFQCAAGCARGCGRTWRGCAAETTCGAYGGWPRWVAYERYQDRGCKARYGAAVFVRKSLSTQLRMRRVLQMQVRTDVPSFT